MNMILSIIRECRSQKFGKAGKNIIGLHGQSILHVLVNVCMLQLKHLNHCMLIRTLQMLALLKNPLHLQNLKKKSFIQALLDSECKNWRANSVDPDEAAHDELPHLDPPCL